jgi:multiple sugar transport system substrate-binding protein
MIKPLGSLRVFLAAVMIPVFTLLAGGGCAKKNNGVVLRCIGWGGTEEAVILQKAVDEFKKAHPGVEVELERAPYAEYVTKVLTQFSAGLAPDVMAVNAEQMIAFASRGVFADLKPFIDKDPAIKLADFYPQAIDHYTLDGVLTALPRDIAPIAVIYYNKKKFDEAGLPYPKDDWTMDDLLATAQKLTRKDATGKTTQFGFVGADNSPAWDAWVYAWGGSLVDNEKKPTRCTVDSPQAIAGVQYLSDMASKYHVMPSLADLTSMGSMGNSDLFMNGTVAMFYSGIWLVPQFKQIKNFDWDVVEFPKGSNGLRSFPMSAAGYGIVKGTKNADLAYELVKYLAGETGEKFMAATGLTQPALKALAQSTVFLDGQTPQSKGFLVDAVQYGHFQPLDPNVAEWMARIDAELDRVWAGEETAAQALKKAASEVNEKFYKK